MRLARRTCFLLTNFYAEARGALGGGGQRIDNVHLPVECSERRARGLRTRGQRSVKPQARVKEVFIPPREAVNSMPPSLAWFWNPSKKIIYGDLLFWYPMGNTPARNLLEGLGPPSSSALLLGCGDIRNVLETCRLAKPVERKLTFALNDFNASTIARDVLLFAIADQIDASNVGDVDFLWSVWYNLQLPEEHFFRLRKVVKEILDGHGEAKSWLKIGGKDLEEVETVYRSWLVEESLLPDVDDVQEMRKERMVEFLNKGKLGEKMGDHGWEKWIKILQEPSLLNLRNASLRELGSEECSLYVETGSITRDDPGDVENFLPNVTLLHPESRRWLNHYGSTPFPAYRGIVTDKNLQDAGGLVKACQRRLQEWVVALQTRTRRERPTVEVSMHCSDALEFCLCGGSSRSFDVIDTTNLADHVGLLNLVLCASSRLINKPGSRLSTSSLTWVFDNENLRDYVDKGLSFNSKFAPTILGLRLVTDLESGKFPVQAQDYMLFGGGGHDERRLDWEPVPCPSPPITVDDALIGPSMQTDEKIPQEPEPCAISVQLARIVRTCCLLPLGKSMRERCGLRLSSPTTLALLLRNMGSRCVLESSGKAPIAGFSDWCKTYCVSFGLEAEKVARLMDSTQGGLVEVRGPLRRDRMLAAMTTSTPIVRVGLVHRSLWEKSTNIELINNALASDLKARHSADMSLVHVIDNASVDDEMNVRFLLPEDHRLEASEWEVVLIDSDRPLGITVHSYSSLESMEQVPFQAPVNLVDRGIERRGGAHIDGARITHLKEYGDRFVAGLSYESSLQDSKIVTKFNQARPDESSLSVDLELQLVPNQSLKIDFPSPVVPHGEKFKRRRSKQEVQCIFPKSSIFPIHASPALELIDVSNLPEHKDEDEVVMKMGRMFSIQEMMFKQSDDNTAVSVDPFYDLRNTIQILFVRLIKDDLRIHLLYGDIEQSKTTDDPILSIVVMGPIRRMDDGEPALLVSYVDHAVDVKARMKAGRFNGHRFACRFQSILSEFGTKGNNIIAVGEEEVKLLRKMLAENSAKMKPSRWQAKHVEDDSEWRPSFVKPMYPENIKTAQVGSRELREKVGKMSVEDAMKELINMELSSGGSPRETVEKLREKGGATEEELKQLESFLGRSSREAGVTTQTGNVQATGEEGSVATKCGNCGITSGLKRCSGCKKIWYCGRDCQKEHWRDHKHQCGK